MLKCACEVRSYFRGSLIFEQGQVTQPTRNGNVTLMRYQGFAILNMASLVGRHYLKASINTNMTDRFSLCRFIPRKKHRSPKYLKKKQQKNKRVLSGRTGLDGRIGLTFAYLIKRI